MRAARARSRPPATVEVELDRLDDDPNRIARVVAILRAIMDTARRSREGRRP